MQASIIFKQRYNNELSCHQKFCMKVFMTPNSKSIIVTLCLVIIQNLEQHLFLYFHALPSVPQISPQSVDNTKTAT